MSPLGARARSVVEVAKGQESPLDDARARVRSALEARLGAEAFHVGGSGRAPSRWPPRAPLHGGGAGEAAQSAAGGLSIAKAVVASIVVLTTLGTGAMVRRWAPWSPASPASTTAAPGPRDERTQERSPAAPAPTAGPTGSPPVDASASRLVPPAPLALPLSSPPAMAPAEASARAADAGQDVKPAARRDAVAARTAPAASVRSDAQAALDPAVGASALTAPSIGAGGPRPLGEDPLVAEATALREAQRLLRSGETSSALRMLDEIAARHPDGVLREERSALRVHALCAAGRIEEARVESARFLRETPRSLLAERVRASCGGAPGGSPSIVTGPLSEEQPDGSAPLQPLTRSSQSDGGQ